MFGCLPKGGAATIASPESEEHVALQQSYPCAVDSDRSEELPLSSVRPPLTNGGADLSTSDSLATPSLPAVGSIVGRGSGRSDVPVQKPVRHPPAQKDSTAARCLVYVRSGSANGGESLINEVRQRVPHTLQERIDARNVDFFKVSAEHVADEFARCARRLTSAANYSGSFASSPGDDDHLCEDLEKSLKVAERIRDDGGLPMARVYLLRACWRTRVPWVPDELCPMATPPDFRMHYGSTAKRLLLDALIRHGQHDIASLVVDKTPSSDGFVPEDIEEWLVENGYF